MCIREFECHLSIHLGMECLAKLSYLYDALTGHFIDPNSWIVSISSRNIIYTQFIQNYCIKGDRLSLYMYTNSCIQYCNFDQIHFFQEL